MKQDYDGLLQILTILRQTSAEIGRTSVAEELPAIWQKRVNHGEPALCGEDFPVQRTVDLLVALVAKLGKTTLDLERAERLVDRYLSDLSTGELWSEAGIAAEKGDVFIHLASQTALADLANVIETLVSFEKWDAKVCPLCGAGPTFGLLESDGGKRRLVCGACMTRWAFRRIGCAYCGEERPEQLRLLDAEEFPGWIASVCLTCRGYLKTADLRKLAVTPDWQQAVTATLLIDYAVADWLSAGRQGV